MAQLNSTNVTGNLSVTGTTVTSKIIKNDGTSDDILLGDGSVASLSQYAKTSSVPTKTSQLTNDSEFITSNDSVKSVIDYGNTNQNIKIGYSGAGISGDNIKYIAGYTTGDSESAMRIKDISKDALKDWLGYATVATSGAYSDLSGTPTFSFDNGVLTITT